MCDNVRGNEQKKGIGARVVRLEDRRFLTGQGRFADDVDVPEMMRAYVVRSPHAHARIIAIDAAVKTSSVLITESAAEGPFRGRAPGYVELQSRELYFPLGGGFVDLWHGGGALRRAVVRKFDNLYRPIAFTGLDAIRESRRTDPLHTEENATT